MTLNDRDRTPKGAAPAGRPGREKLSDIPVGVVGMGLMGTSIATCLLGAGHPVVALEAEESKRVSAKRRVLALLKESKKERVLKGEPSRIIKSLAVAGESSALRACQIVVEAITENVEAKRQAIRKVEEAVTADAIIASNTSAIPISALQQGAKNPERILGLHWAEPAHVTRFMEIICGKESRLEYAEKAAALARRWGKEPSLVRRDIRGFITNRCFYALLREAFHLVESGYATPADVDRSLRNDLGYWITFAGPFRFLDLTGIPAYATVMRDLFPELSSSTEVPAKIASLVESGAKGVSNAKGFYDYTPAQAKRWERLFLKFSYEIRALAGKYPEDVGDRPA
jgi:3-hydroxyacyl-CoA dehydrogenase